MDERLIIFEHRRDDAGSPIGGGGDDAPTCRILLVHGERVEAHPFEHEAWVGAGTALEQPLADRTRAARHVQAAGQLAGALAAAVDRSKHRDADAIKKGVGLALVAPGGLVGADDLGDGEAGGVAGGEQFGGRSERVGDGDIGAYRLLALHADRAPADRVIAPGDATAVGQHGGEGHAVGVGGQEALVEDEVLVLAEGNGDVAAERQGAALADAGDELWNAVGIDSLGRLAGEAQQDRAVGAVAAPGERERSVEVALQAHRHDAFVGELAREGIGRAHRPDGVGTGRADADGEQLHDADRGAGRGLGRGYDASLHVPRYARSR